MAEPRVERRDVVVLQVDLDEGLPVVLAHMLLDVVEHIAAEVQFGLVGHAGQRLRHVEAVALEQQPVPVLRRVEALQVQAGVMVEVRRADQAALQVVGPAVQRTHDVAPGLSASAQHHRLAVAAHVRYQLDAAGRAHQCAALALVRQSAVVAHLG